MLAEVRIMTDGKDRLFVSRIANMAIGEAVKKIKPFENCWHIPCWRFIHDRNGSLKVIVYRIVDKLNPRLLNTVRISEKTSSDYWQLPCDFVIEYVA